MWNIVNEANIVLNIEDIMFGITDVSQYSLNCSILILKYHIHASLCTESVYSFEGFKCYLKRKVEMEKYVLLKSNKKELFKSRWNDIFMNLSE